MLNTTPLLVTFIAYTAIIFVIAYISTKLSPKLSDFVLGGRSLSGPVTALAAGASDMSSWLLMAVPGSFYLFGISMAWLPIALVIGAYCNWKFIAKRLRIYTEIAKDSLTIPEFLVNRFHDKGLTLRIVTSLVIIIFFTFYSAAGFVSGAVLLKNTFVGLEYLPALAITAGVIVLYTAIGGFLAVSWVDTFQGTLMFFALVTVPLVTAASIHSETKDIYAIISQNAPVHLDIWQGTTFLGMLSLLAWGFGYFGQVHINTRFMAIRSAKELPLARRICMAWMTIALIGAGATGMIGYAFYVNAPLADSNTLFINLAQRLFNPWLSGILLSAIVSAVMSTVSAQILISASILVEDFYHDMFRKKASNFENFIASRLILLLVAGFAVAIAANPKQSIFNAVGFAWSGLGASFGPVLIFSLFWRRMTKWAAVWGIIVGCVTVILVGTFFKHPDIHAGFELLPGFALSSLVIVLVSLKSAKPSAEVLADFDKARVMSKHYPS